MKINKNLAKLFFALVGLGALIWFLVRVIPKPSRATYPCQRAAFPIASGFIIYLLSLASSSFAFLKLKKHWKAGDNWAALIFLIIIIISGFFVLQSDKPYIYANYQSVPQDPNQPIGEGKGIFPGRVVWVRDSTAVNQQYTNQTSTYWWNDVNSNQTAINNMVSKAIKTITGKESDLEAWDAIFRYYNITHGRGDVGYSAGEKIVIKLNLNTGASGNSYTRPDDRTIDTSPQVVYAVLDQLINIADVSQVDIGFGDPGRNVDNIFWDKFHQIFPNVKYWGNANGRTPIEPSNSKIFFTSDGKLQHFYPSVILMRHT